MTNEEARAYFIDCNERIMSVAKDENIYNYETQQVEDVFMRRTFEANELAIKALEQDPQETVTEFADRCKECGAYYGRLLNQKWTPVSEGLPEDDRYLTTILNEYDNSLRYVMTCDFINGDWCPDDECASNNVIAWMPLPKPYVPDTNIGKMSEIPTGSEPKEREDNYGDCDSCLNKHTDNCNNCMVTEYKGKRVSFPTNYRKVQ